jgi:hypothetical protein
MARLRYYRNPWSEFSFWRANRAGTVAKVPLDQLPGEAGHISALRRGAQTEGNKVAAQWGRLGLSAGSVDEDLKSFRDAVASYNEEKAHRSADTPVGECRYMSGIVYGLVMLVLWVGELPLNKVVLQLLRMPSYFDYLVAGVIGLVLLVCAHVIGVELKKYVRTREDNWHIAALLGLVAVIICGMALIRRIYIVGQLTQPNSEVTQTYAVVTVGLIAVQCLIFWGALIAAYAYHIPAARNTLLDCRGRYVSKWVLRHKLWKTHRWEVEAVCSALDRVKDEYVAANLRKVADKAKSPLLFYLLDFDDEEIIEKPSSLRTLDGEPSGTPARAVK